MGVTLTTDTAPEVAVTIEPKLRRKLLIRLRVLEELASQKKAIELAIAGENAQVELIRDQVGEKSLRVEGFTITRVTGTSKSLNWKKLKALGVTDAMRALATVEKPKKPYTLVTLPGAAKEADADEDAE